MMKLILGASLAAAVLMPTASFAQTCPHRFQHCDPYAPNLPAPPPKKHLKGCAVNPSNPSQCIPTQPTDDLDDEI